MLIQDPDVRDIGPPVIVAYPKPSIQRNYVLHDYLFNANKNENYISAIQFIFKNVFVHMIRMGKSIRFISTNNLDRLVIKFDRSI